MELKKEKSCGCIIIKDGKVLLILEKSSKKWGFPKGHMEEGENEIQTALREVKEEVGLDVEIDTSKRYTLNYIVNDNIDKTSVYYIASTKDDKVTRQESEIEDAKWCNFEEALNIITFNNCREMFKKAIEDIK